MSHVHVCGNNNLLIKIKNKLSWNLEPFSNNLNKIKLILIILLLTVTNY